MTNKITLFLFTSVVVPLMLGVTVPSTSIQFSEPASGGILHILMSDDIVTIYTKKGERAESVLEKISTALERVVGYKDLKGSSLVLHNYIPYKNQIAFTGTENGLGIPENVKFFTVVCNPKIDSLNMHWEASASVPYFSVSGAINMRKIDAQPSKYALPFERLMLDRSPLGRLGIQSYNQDIPSSRSAINLEICAFSELYSYPFKSNLIGNWDTWDGSNVDFYEAHKISRTSRFKMVNPENNIPESYSTTRALMLYKTPNAKPLYQSIRIHGDSSSFGGIYRKFLGLTPGHTYRIHARLNTFEATPDSKDWAFTMHATANTPGNNQLTTEQFMGTAPLPNGASGKEAALIAEYGTGKAVTNGQWEHFSTASPQCPDCIGDITLPEGADTITTWLHLEGQADLEVGFDWIKLEDLTCMQENGITPMASSE